MTRGASNPNPAHRPCQVLMSLTDVQIPNIGMIEMSLPNSADNVNRNVVPPPPPVPPSILRAIARRWEVFPLVRGTKSSYFRTTCKDGSVSNSWQQQATN